MNMIKSRIKKVISSALSVPNEKIDFQVNHAEIISFDIFDTLVRRKVEHPSDIFDIVSARYFEISQIQLLDYKKLRIDAELRARKKINKEEIVFEDIFDELSHSIKADINLLKELEIETEISNCYASPFFTKLYHMCKTSGKVMVITSDMYLSEAVIKTILQNCGYDNYEKLYLSSQYCKTKYTGSLFEILKKDYHGKDIMHIGDNIISDFLRPKSKSIKALLINDNQNQLKYWTKKPKLKDATNLMDYQKIRSAMNKNLVINEEQKEMQHIGYEVLGPILFGFCQFIHKKVREDGIEKLFFLSRDGKIIQRVYQILYPEETTEQKYLYVSRLALIVPQMSEAKNFDDVIQILKPLLHIFTLKSLQEICRFEEKIFTEEITAIGYSEDTEINKIAESDKKTIYEIIMKMGRNYFQEQKNYMIKYLHDSEFEGKVGVVDIGWNGTIQKALKKYINGNTEIYGYYWGVRNIASKDYYSSLIRKGYLFDSDSNSLFSLMFRFTAEIVDTLVLGTDGTTLAYKKSENGIIPICDNSEYGKHEQEMVMAIQNNAIKFVCMAKGNLMNEISEVIAREIIILPYEKFAICCKNKTLKLFSDFYLTDNGTIKKILPQYSLLYYIFHLKQLKNEFNMNICKIWFLKGLFKVPFPYFKILCMLQKSGIKSGFQKRMEYKGKSK